MKILKTILLIIVILIALPFVIAIFVKRDYAVERDIVINKPKAEVFDYVKYVKNQYECSTWSKADPAMKRTYSGTDGTVGFIYEWNGNGEVGEGQQEITAITEGEKIDMDLRFKRPFEGNGHAFMATKDTLSGTKLTWSMKGNYNYPVNFLNLFSGKMLGGALEEGLTNIKNNLEK